MQCRRTFLASVAATVGLAGCSVPVDVERELATVEENAEPFVQSTRTEREPVSEEFGEDVRDRASSVGVTARESVVVLTSGRSGGTGWVVGDGEIVTNAHVVQGSQQQSVETFDGRTGTAELVGTHDSLDPDVALLETDLSVPPLPLGSVDSLSRGDPLVTVGHPGMVGDWVISLGRHLDHDEVIDWLLSTVPTQRGNSGGPLLTLSGDVVGVVSGGTFGSSARDEYSKSEKAFTEMPDIGEKTTSVPTPVIEDSLSEWR